MKKTTTIIIILVIIAIVLAIAEVHKLGIKKLNVPSGHVRPQNPEHK